MAAKHQTDPNFDHGRALLKINCNDAEEVEIRETIQAVIRQVPELRLFDLERDSLLKVIYGYDQEKRSVTGSTGKAWLYIRGEYSTIVTNVLLGLTPDGEKKVDVVREARVLTKEEKAKIEKDYIEEVTLKTGKVPDGKSWIFITDLENIMDEAASEKSVVVPYIQIPDFRISFSIGGINTYLPPVDSTVLFCSTTPRGAAQPTIVIDQDNVQELIRFASFFGSGEPEYPKVEQTIRGVKIIFDPLTHDAMVALKFMLVTELADSKTLIFQPFIAPPREAEHPGGYRGRGEHPGGYRGRGEHPGGYRGRGEHPGGYRGRGEHPGGYRGRGEHPGGYRGRGGRR
jgi:hypothetical protein